MAFSQVPELGAMYGSKPGCYLVAAERWDGPVPDGIEAVFRCPSPIGYLIPRVFMDDTAADREAVQPFLREIMAYPLSRFTGEPQTRDWSAVPSFPAQSDAGEQEIQWVDPTTFFDVLPTILDTLPPLPGEQALYESIRPVVDAARADDAVKQLLIDTAVAADAELVKPLFNFNYVGAPVANGWTSPADNAEFGTDYRTRTACAKSNIFVNKTRETAYFYLEDDAGGETLDGAHAYTVTFPAGELPLVEGFWSLTLSNQHHFFHPNPLERYSLGTKNRDLEFAPDGSLTIFVGTEPPVDQPRANWLPAPAGKFELYLRRLLAGAATARREMGSAPGPDHPRSMT